MKKPRRRRRTTKQRRGNPGMMPLLLANPRRRKPRARGGKRSGFNFDKVRSMLAGMGGKKPRRRRRKANPHMLAKSGKHFRRRRANPSIMGFAAVVRIGIFGGIGIVTARVVGYLYSKHLKPIVMGTETDANGWRAWLNDALRAIVQEVAILGITKGAAKMGIGNDMDRRAFMIGGSAETARGALGAIVGHLSPSTSRPAWGMDGPPDGYEYADGTIWMLDPATGRYVIVEGDDAEAFAGLEEAEAFAGLEEAEAFAGAEDDYDPEASYEADYGYDDDQF